MTARRHQAGQAVPGALWSSRDAVVCGLLLVVGLVLCTGSWYRAADQLTLDRQVAALNVAVIGTLVSTAGFALWFLRGRRAINVRRRALIARRRALLLPVATPTATPTLAPRSISPVLVGGEGLRRFHRADCPLAAGRADWLEASSLAHQAAGRSECGVCRP